MGKSGILLPVFSLSTEYGIGTLGKEAMEFIDFLNDSRQTYWQVLPIGPTGYGDSPYQSFSAFANNPYLIDIEELKREELITEDDIRESGIKNIEGKIDYGNIFENKMKLLRKASENIDINNKEYKKYIEDNSFWIKDYSMFMAIKENNVMKPFWEWDEKLRFRDRDEMKIMENSLYDRINFWNSVQFIFFRQWKAIKEYANSLGIKIIGDIPIYVSPDSADLWSKPELFVTDEKGMPTEVAGCPPDSFAPKGQLWGNPLYDWEYHKKHHYGWWIKRLKVMSQYFDLLRIDHFRGFSGYYSIPVGNITAEEGSWKKGPGKDFIDEVKTDIGDIQIIAENLGFITEDVHELLEYSGFYGMKVMQFGFSDNDSVHLPRNYEKNCVAYTGTHDNETLSQWICNKSREELEEILKYLDSEETETEEIGKLLIERIFESMAETVIVPIQDWLGVGSEGRMNIPGNNVGNWQWRLKNNQLTQKSVNEIRKITMKYGREKK